jgi:hypothetical protein
MNADVDALRAYITEHLGHELIEWPGGRPGEAEVALVDAVMSIRARYGRPARTVDDIELAPTGVHRAVGSYRRLRGDKPLDDLSALARVEAAALTEALGTQRTGGVLKADAIRQGAAALTAAGVTCAEEVNPADETQKRAYTSVKGLGWVTWEYFGMLLGRPGVKADRWVIQAVTNGIRRPVTAREARTVVLQTAADMGHDPTRLEHALWAYERTRPTN